MLAAVLLLASGSPLFGRQDAPPPPDSVWTNSMGTRFVHIPAGSFRMGSEDGDPEEKPVHEVALSEDFWLGEVEVVQAEWEAVMGAHLSRYDGCADCPVSAVSWEDVEAFIERLNEWESGRGYRYRLPTEAEWEYACRAGSEAAYGFGDEPDSLAGVAWYLDDSLLVSQPVALKEPNAWGLYDMHGNVSEWTADVFDENYYARSPERDPKGPEAGLMRVYRGGSWNEGAYALRSAHRFGGIPTYRYESVGFRLARTRTSAERAPE